MKKAHSFPMFLALVFLTSDAFAANYYVSALNGNNSFPGTEAQPYATIKKAADLTNPGDTVFIMNGTYTPVSNFQQSIVTITRSGTEGAYITYKAFPGHTPKLQLKTGLNFQIWRAVAIDASYIVFSGIEIEGTNQSLDSAGAYQTWQDYENGIKDWNKISMYNCGSISIGGDSAVHHVIVSNCKIYNTGGGIGAFTCDYITIENNLVYNTCWYSMYAGSGISILDPKSIDLVTGYKMFVRNNIVHNNKTLIPWELTNALSDGNGIILDVNIGNGTTTFPYVGRYLVENNVAYNNGGGGIHAYKAAHVDIINNTAYNNGTVVGYPEIDGIFGSDVTIYNNIMYARSGGACNSNDATATYNYNLYYNGPSYRQGANDIIATNPQFVLPALNGTSDFSLKNISPALNTGSYTAGQFSTSDILGVSRPVGARPDMGAYEYTGTSGNVPGFSMGNIAVLRVGDGSAALGTDAAAVNILEYAPNGAAGTMNVVLGDASSTVPNRLLLSGDNTTSEGQLNLSSDGRYLSVAGYEAAVGTAAATYKANEKVIARIAFDGSVNYSTRISAATMNGTVRSTVTSNSSRFYITGTSTSPASGNSTRFVSFGTPATTGSTAFFGGVRSLAMFKEQVYYAQNNTVGSLTPNPSAGNYGTSVLFPGVNTSGHNYQALALLDADATANYLSTGYDVLYCADANLGLVKYYWNGTTWVLAGTFNPASATGVTGGLYALTARINEAGNAQIYAVKGAASNNEVLALTDASGFTGSITATPPAVVAITSAGTNYMFRGVAFTPSQLVTLPVDLLSFKASVVSNDVLLDWTTSSEINAKEFIIERSKNGRTFTDIAKVAAKNFLNGSAYSFTDPAVSGQVYYRLKSLDKDGSTKYSNIITVRVSDLLVTRLTVFPNPVATHCSVSYPVATTKASVSIYREDGSKVGEYAIAIGSTQRSIDVSSLNSGHYFMVYRNNHKTITGTFIK